MDRFVLMSFYRDYIYKGSTTQYYWRVVGHYQGGHNEIIGDFDTEAEAINQCFRAPYIPVVKGEGVWVSNLAQILALHKKC